MKFIRVWMYSIACIVLLHHAGGTARALESSPSLSEKEKIRLAEQAVDLYKKGDVSAARQQFETVAPMLRENPAVPYYLGLIYYEQGQRPAAIDQWQRYLALRPQGDNSMVIRKYLTLLRHEHAEDEAKAAVALEMVPPKAQIIAVNAFESKGYSILGPIGKGMAALLTSDLSKIPGVKVVGREQMGMMLRETATGNAGLGDLTPETAGRMGSLLKAAYVTSGKIVDLDTENMQISINVFDVNADSEVAGHKAKGPLLEFYNLQKKITCDVASAIGRNCRQLPEGVIKMHTSQLPALVAFGWGLDNRDKQRYDKAREMFRKALAKDTNFELAEQFLLDTPTSAMARKSRAEIIAELSTSAPAPITTAGTSGQSKWKSRTLYAAGGLAVIAGGAALAGGGGGGEGPDTGIDSTNDLDGKWYATLDSTLDGQLNLDMTKNGDNTTPGTINGWSCFSSMGSIEIGEWSGSSVQLTIKTSDQLAIQLNGTVCESRVDNNCVSFSGSWSRNFESCQNTEVGGGSFVGGTFKLDKSGSIIIGN